VARVRKLVHKFLIWFPVAVFSGGIAIAELWGEAKVWITEQVLWAWSEASDPWITTLLVGVVAAYIVAILWTGQERSTASTAPEDVTPVSISQIVIDCDNMPRDVISGEHHVLDILSPDDGNATVQVLMSSGTFNAMDRFTYVCKVTNYGPAALINLRIPLQVIQHEVWVQQSHSTATTITLANPDPTIELKSFPSRLRTY